MLLSAEHVVQLAALAFLRAHAAAVESDLLALLLLKDGDCEAVIVSGEATISSAVVETKAVGGGIESNFTCGSGGSGGDESAGGVRAQALLAGFAVHPSCTLRLEYFQFLIWLADNHPAIECKVGMEPAPSLGGRQASALRRALTRELVQGLRDEASAVRALLYEYWDHPSRLSEVCYIALDFHSI